VVELFVLEPSDAPLAGDYEHVMSVDEEG